MSTISNYVRSYKVTFEATDDDDEYSQVSVGSLEQLTEILKQDAYEYQELRSIINQGPVKVL